MSKFSPVVLELIAALERNERSDVNTGTMLLGLDPDEHGLMGCMEEALDLAKDDFAKRHGYVWDEMNAVWQKDDEPMVWEPSSTAELMELGIYLTAEVLSALQTDLSLHRRNGVLQLRLIIGGKS